jgi:hypothetical protein
MISFMEGFWIVEFRGIQGWGGGVATLMAGKLFGGDSAYLYLGSYTSAGNSLTAHVHVKLYAEEGMSVMGQTEFDLDVNGTRQGDTVTVIGTIPGTPLELHGSLTKKLDLPAR